MGREERRRRRMTGEEDDRQVSSFEAIYCTEFTH